MSKNNFRAWNQDIQEFEYFTFGKNGHYTHSKLEIYSANAVKDWQQFTGLKDKNGVEIYEGDIIRHHDHHGEVVYGEVSWDERNASFTPGIGLMSEASEWLEVIGNIHENPELLKELN